MKPQGFASQASSTLIRYEPVSTTTSTKSRSGQTLATLLAAVAAFTVLAFVMPAGADAAGGRNATPSRDMPCCKSSARDDDRSWAFDVRIRQWQASGRRA